MQRTKRNRALKSITSSTKKSHTIASNSSLDKENIVNQSTPKDSSIRKEDEELSKIFQNAMIRSIEKDEVIHGRYCLPRRSHESVSEFDLEVRLNRKMIQKPIARIRSPAKENRDDVVVTVAANSSTVVRERRPSEHVFSSIGSAFEPNFPL